MVILNLYNSSHHFIVNHDLVKIEIQQNADLEPLHDLSNIFLPFLSCELTCYLKRALMLLLLSVDLEASDQPVGLTSHNAGLL